MAMARFSIPRTAESTSPMMTLRDGRKELNLRDCILCEMTGLVSVVKIVRVMNNHFLWGAPHASRLDIKTHAPSMPVSGRGRSVSGAEKSRLKFLSNSVNHDRAIQTPALPKPTISARPSPVVSARACRGC